MPISTDEEYDLEVNAAGLNCPLPLLRLKKAIMQINSGEIVKMIATDPAAHLDVGVYVEQSGHKMLSATKIKEMHIFFIKKS